MKIVVLSDTHMPKKAKTYPSQLVTDLQSAQLIIHAGDWQTAQVYEQLSQYSQVVGVTGNVDNEEIQQLFGEKLVLPIGPFKIGVVHGHGQKLTTEKRALAAFKNDDVDCIIYGHSHIPVLKKVNDILLFNPGSVTDKRRQPNFSYGVLTIGKTIEAEHVFITDKNS
ncbi:metallophosphoesterase family protein [Alkalihalobacterium alkalinitrilicum]|uniref:metallophosphoesterase family protein n=1 Tax=Alkalihalobacterium alkalinitrilicum TaxID=427920 RepID=UPI00099550E5|nr:metallophosphoesterase family protein [Alkalihalobacterium alkalinitrilicum]